MPSSTEQFLAGLELLAPLTVEEISRIADRVRLVNHGKGTVLAVQGKTRLDQVYIIKAGILEMFNEVEGEKTLTTRIGAGEIFGGISLLMNAGISVRTVRVESDLSAYVLSKDYFLKLAQQFPGFHQYFADLFSRRMLDESYASLVATGQLRSFLSGIVPFSFLPETEVLEAAAALSPVVFKKNTVVFVQDQSTVEHLHIIEKGAAERYYEEQGAKRLHSLMGEGDIYGGISILVNKGVAVRTLRTLEDTRFLRLPKAHFLELCRHRQAFLDFFTDTFGKRMLDRTYAEIIARKPGPGYEQLPLLNQPVAQLCSRELVACSADMSIQKAALIMSQHHCSSILIQDHQGRYVGIVTDNDLRRKVIAKGHAIDRPVVEVMSAPLLSIGANAMVLEALLAMMQNNLKHLAVTDPRGQVIGIVTHQDMVKAQGQSPLVLVRQIAAADTMARLVEIHGQVPAMVRGLIQSGAKAQNITGLITTISDHILNKIITMVMSETSPPPVPFVFMIMGSEGRKEQTLKTDQDNAIVYQNVPAAEDAAVKAYFLEVGTKICDLLDQAGYSFCQGNVMAKNPRWCMSLSQWQNAFSAWVHAAQAQDLLHSSIFFDFRGAYGDLELIEKLRWFLFSLLEGWMGFFRHLTENALLFKPPIGFFRNFVVESKGRHRDALDIKSAMTPIVDFARIYTLKNSLSETNTVQRLHQLYLKEVLSWGEYRDLEQAYSFLMQLRFVRQAAMILDENAAPDNYINPKKLSRIEQTMLKEVFKRIEYYQQRLDFEFTNFS
jgi:CBS domain-containing protein